MEINRDGFRNMAAGNFVITSQEPTIKREDLDKYIQGAMYAYDFITKQKLKLVQTEGSVTIHETPAISRSNNP